MCDGTCVVVQTDYKLGFVPQFVPDVGVCRLSKRRLWLLRLLCRCCDAKNFQRLKTSGAIDIAVTAMLGEGFQNMSVFVCG